MHIQIKHREIHEEKCFKYENGCVMDDSDDGDEHKNELCVKKDAEIVVDVCCGDAADAMPGHKPDNRKEYRACKNVVGPILFGDVYHTKYPDEENHDSEEGPPYVECDTSLVFVGDSEYGHDEHRRCNEVSRLE